MKDSPEAKHLSSTRMGFGDGGMPAPLVIVCGHYGVGKTNLSLNLAHVWAGEGYEVTLIDLDVVNPYFRSSEFSADMSKQGIRVIAPVFAGTNLDGPSLSPAIRGAIEQAAEQVRGDRAEESRRVLLIDAGGDDAGATALGRYAEVIQQLPYELWYVVNRCRSLTQTAGEAVDILHEIEAASQLQVTGIVNNTHLQTDTTIEIIREGISFAEEVAEETGLALMGTTVPAAMFEQVADRKTTLLEHKDSSIALVPVQVYVRTPWE